MAFAFDTLGYAKRLRDSGVAQDHAEAHAEAAREFSMTELVTKSDLLAVRADMQAVKVDLRAEMQAIKVELQNSINALRSDMDHLALRLTVRLGGLMVAGIGALALLQRLN